MEENRINSESKDVVILDSDHSLKYLNWYTPQQILP